MDQWILRVCEKKLHLPTVVSVTSPAEGGGGCCLSFPRKAIPPKYEDYVHPSRGATNTNKIHQKRLDKSTVIQKSIFLRFFFEESAEQKKNITKSQLSETCDQPLFFLKCPKTLIDSSPLSFPTWEVVETWQLKPVFAVQKKRATQATLNNL